MKRNPLSAITLACVAAAFAIVTLLQPALAQNKADVAIANYAFAPAALTVAPGTTVTWTNKDGGRHSVKFADQESGAWRAAPPTAARSASRASSSTDAPSTRT